MRYYLFIAREKSQVRGTINNCKSDTQNES